MARLSAKCENDTPAEGIMWFIRGQCTQCGKLTPPVFADPEEDDMLVLGRLRYMLQSTDWWVDIYRLFQGPKPGAKVICRCPMCEKELKSNRTRGSSPVTTIVTTMDDSQAETTKGVT